MLKLAKLAVVGESGTVRGESEAGERGEVAVVVECAAAMGGELAVDGYVPVLRSAGLEGCLLSAGEEAGAGEVEGCGPPLRAPMKASPFCVPEPGVLVPTMNLELAGLPTEVDKVVVVGKGPEPGAALTLAMVVAVGDGGGFLGDLEAAHDLPADLAVPSGVEPGLEFDMEEYVGGVPTKDVGGTPADDVSIPAREIDDSAPLFGREPMVMVEEGEDRISMDEEDDWVVVETEARSSMSVPP